MSLIFHAFLSNCDTASDMINLRRMFDLSIGSCCILPNKTVRYLFASDSSYAVIYLATINIRFTEFVVMELLIKFKTVFIVELLL